MKPLLHIFCFLIITSCNSIKDKTNQTIHKTAETVGEVGTKVVTKIGDGVANTLKSQILLDTALIRAGIENGKFMFNDDKEGNQNILSVYFIFNKNYDGQLQVFAFDESQLEYGRAIAKVTAKAGEAKYIDFMFDKRVNLENKSTFKLKEK